MLERERSNFTEDLLLAEFLETCSVLIWLDRRQSRAILAKQDCLHKPLTLLVKVPLLKEVDQGDMINTIAGDEAVLLRHPLTDINQLNYFFLDLLVSIFGDAPHSGSSCSDLVDFVEER